MHCGGVAPPQAASRPAAGRSTPSCMGSMPPSLPRCRRHRLPPPPPGRRQSGGPVACAALRDAPGRQPPREEGSREADELQMWMDRLAGMRPTARSLALLQLLRIEQEGAFAGLVGGSPGADSDPDDSLELADDGTVVAGSGGGTAAPQRQRPGRSWSARLDPRQARLVTELVGGVTRWRRRLDYTLGQLLRGRDPQTLDPPLRQALRLGLYELTELKNADHGVVDTYVELMKGVMHQGAANVANGTLRNVVRGLASGDLPLPPPPAKGMPAAEAVEALAVGASHPTWLVARWMRQYGPQATLGLLRHNNLRPRYALRLAPGVDAEAFCARLAQGGVVAQPSRFLPSEFVTLDRGLQALLADGLVQRGQAQVQDEAAGLVVAALDPQPGETLLDACAAPGGKALFAAARMRGRGIVTALDVSRTRLAALRRAAEKQPHGGIVRTFAADLRRFAALRFRPEGPAPPTADGAAAEPPTPEAAEPAAEAAPAAEGRQPWHYDRVLLDAPCSGTGVLAKRADMRWRRTAREVGELAALQGELLEAAAGLVAPGGVLVYSTCSVEAEENQLAVAGFLARHPEFEVEAPPAVPPACLTPEGFLCMLPHVHGTDGAFAARLRRSALGGPAGGPASVGEQAANRSGEVATGGDRAAGDGGEEAADGGGAAGGAGAEAA